jgi:hypothetical protein
MAALLGLAASLAVAIFTFGMPAHMAFLSAAYRAEEMTLAISASRTIRPNCMWCIGRILYIGPGFAANVFEAGFIAWNPENSSAALRVYLQIVEQVGRSIR